MPTLLETQRGVYRSLVRHDNGGIAQHILGDGLTPEARLDVYRNTFTSVLTNALRLAFPAVHRLVGAEFFEGSAAVFVQENPPRAACLDAYGVDFPAFLEGFPPAASLRYLSGVARLEWAVSKAIHAFDEPALGIDRLAALAPTDHERLAFIPHPSVSLVHSEYPVDAIWHAVLDQDDAAMGQIDLDAGPVWLMVQRRENRIEVVRCVEPAWRFAAALFASLPLQAAVEAVPEVEAPVLLADHLAAGRFAAFTLVKRRSAKLAPEDPS